MRARTDSILLSKRPGFQNCRADQVCSLPQSGVRSRPVPAAQKDLPDSVSVCACLVALVPLALPADRRPRAPARGAKSISRPAASTSLSIRLASDISTPWGDVYGKGTSGRAPGGGTHGLRLATFKADGTEARRHVGLKGEDRPRNSGGCHRHDAGGRHPGRRSLSDGAVSRFIRFSRSRHAANRQIAVPL